jgi:dissimilatory sulfite reductase (desulfoviridin) alpha/beta subunit
VQRRSQLGILGGLLAPFPQLCEAVTQIAQVAIRKQLALARIGEFLHRIGARRFKQPVAHRVALRFGDHERLIDERRQHVERVEFVELLAAPNRSGSLQRKAVNEDA